MAPIAADKIFIAQPFWIQRRISPDIAGWWDFFARRHARRLSMLERDALHSLNASLMQAERSSAEGNSASAVTAMPGQRNRELQSLLLRIVFMTSYLWFEGAATALRNGMTHSRENNDDGDHKKPLCLVSISFSKSKESPTIDSVAS